MNDSLQLVIKYVYSSLNISQFVFQSLLNTYEFSNVCILTFCLEINQNFKSCQNLLITLGLMFLYYKLQLCFICHVHYTPIYKW
jgi:hypothetical protein